MTRGKRSWDKRLDIDALKQWRQRIDATDAEIVRLLNQRARIAQEIGNARTADVSNAAFKTLSAGRSRVAIGSESRGARNHAKIRERP